MLVKGAIKKTPRAERVIGCSSKSSLQRASRRGVVGKSTGAWMRVCGSMISGGQSRTIHKGPTGSSSFQGSAGKILRHWPERRKQRFGMSPALYGLEQFIIKGLIA